jgi:hypothetical protein
MSTLRELLELPDVVAATLEAHLDAREPLARIGECRALSARHLARLWELTAGGLLALDDFLGSDGKPMEFAGKNSLPMFTHFEKHFVRHGGEVVGINVGATSFATGPGYFTCDVTDEKPGEVRFDYTRVPSEKPVEQWPSPRSNASGISFFVYRNMHDYNRRVSKDVVIGAATRLGKPIGQYYVLARKPS